MAPEPHPESIWSVSKVTRKIRNLIEINVGEAWVEGEVSNLRIQRSGHQYFTLKDDGAQLSCAMFKSSAMRQRHQLEDGQKVLVFGEFSVYEARGSYQLIAKEVRPRGLGDLQARFERLKQKLAAEGVFDQERKQALPTFPTCVAVVTSATGAALQDMLNVWKRRSPWLHIIVSPVRVQGSGAEHEIARAVEDLNSWAINGVRTAPDLIIVARGGGSLEDLWCFNEEIVARTIAASELPVVSGVGHEIDFTIADLVADARAPTPSAAAEIVAPDMTELKQRIAALTARGQRHVSRHLDTLAMQLRGYATSTLFQTPRFVLRESQQKLDSLLDELGDTAEGAIKSREELLRDHKEALSHLSPTNQLNLIGERLDRFETRITAAVQSRLDRQAEKLSAVGKVLKAIGPEHVIKRGYSLTTDSKGKILRDPAEVQRGERLITRLAKGEIRSTVDECLSFAERK